MAEKLAPLLDGMALYLESDMTQGILFKPVRRKVVQAIAETRTILKVIFPARGLRGPERRLGDVTLMPMISPAR